MKIIVVVHASATLMMVGIIWFVQIVHYPLYNRIGQADFVRYETDHTTLVSLVVMPLMLVEAVTAVWLTFDPPAAAQPALIWGGLLLVALIWGATFLLQVPLHSRLAQGFDKSAHETLVATNWIRTIAWSVRGALVAVLVISLLGESNV